MVRKKIILTTIIASLSGASIGFIPSFVINKKSSYKISNANINDQSNNLSNNNLINEELNKLTPTQANSQNTFLSAKTGPIVYWGSKISSLDWFGGERWSVDLDTMMENPFKTGDWKRSWFNYDYDRTNNILYILTSGASWSNVKQRLLAIDVETGKDAFTGKEINEQNKISSIDFPQTNSDVRFLTVLKNGNVLMYGGAKTGLNGNAYLYDKNQNKIETVNHKFEEHMNMISKPSDSKWYFFNLIPVSNNRNLVEIVNFTTKSGVDIGNGVNDANFNVYFILVDDKLNIIKNNKWSKPKLAANGINGYKNSKITPQRDYYYFADGKVVTVLYNRIIIVDPNGDVDFKSLKLSDEDKWVLSWTFDSGENLFFKYKDDGFIYASSSTSVKSTQDNSLVNLNTYFDINSSSQNGVNKYAKDYILYNVHGYYGQIMMLNSYFNTDPNFKEITKEEIETNQYGLAVAITSNENNPLFGDIKGLLNTDKAFIKSSDFSIDDSILNNKLPSEISRQDLTITNDGFFTQNTEKNNNGTLKYPQFVKEVINDDGKKNGDQGNLKITANIDQIPWFVNNNVMPSDIAPLTITKWFNTKQKISDRVNWKDVNLDYDFKNTLPSKVTIDDVKRFSPFSINITSQKTTIGGVSYPKEEYKITERKDETGEIKITMEYSYLPIDVEAKSENILKQRFEKTFNIFKTSDEKKFNFVGNGQTEENINSIPQLKELSESNLLPSSISSEDNSSILRFINTDTSSGYPLSKMKFNVTPNDNNGTLKITAVLPKEYYGDQEDKVFTKTYTGLNKTSNYKFIFNANPKEFNKNSYRPSEVSEQDIYKYFVMYSGYNSSDLSINLQPNDETGELQVTFYLNGDYPESIANNYNGFVKTENGYEYVVKVDGFQTNDEYEKQYQVNFIDDNDFSLNDIKKFTPKQISLSLKNISSKIDDNKNIIINGKEIKTEEELAKALIKSTGSKIPKVEDLNQNNFSYEIYYNDPNGEITIKLTFKNIQDINSDLVFIQRYTGFAKGNQVTTNDILSFKTQDKLMFDNSELKKLLPSEIASMLNDKNSRVKELNKFLNYYSGDYKKSIDNNKFDLDVVYDDIFGYLTIKIVFDRTDIVDTNSLLSYTATYNGFMHE
ncbi:lipoprotein 17-related variable surface protein [Malacoplasma iowae]|nr:lipoprotein 17-related variable surface protein [Malacoplasma iowae]WPL36383.1 lipoprotein 17-related variable surface protein [Malacoplasma iowae]WPL37453.1 lipoprotein 17-related variable surface protein [Malacoplasma iowae]WPL40996.1 lipoprotein 17-related variable surface protein [Malacoplasma iowae]